MVNFGSGAGAFGDPGLTGYGTAKEGVRGLSKVVAFDGGADNIRINVAAPVAMAEGLQTFRKNSPEAFEALLYKVPPRRAGAGCSHLAG